MKDIKRISMGQFPTPVQRLMSIEKMLSDKIKLYIKRDDLCGIGLGGNKIRKLEFILSYAMEQGCDTLITTGGVQSNHAFLTAISAAKYGLDVELYLMGEKPQEKQGNVLLEEILGVTPKFIDTRNFRQIYSLMKDRVEKLRDCGKNPLLVPVGGSMKEGIPGYVFAAEEILSQMREIGDDIDRIVCCAGSGGTYAGLILGTKMHRPQIKVTAVSVVEDKDMADRVWKMIEDTCEYLEIENSVVKRDLEIYDYSQPGYALSSEAGSEAIRQLARREGIFTDPVYTGKTLAGLADLTDRGIIEEGERVLFIHSGGAAALFAVPLTGEKAD